MAKKKELVVNKMYVWNIEVDGEDYEWKCFVGIDECITYGNGVELERLRIENMVQRQGVLQIDTQVKVGDEMVPFQLERGVPYIKLLEDDGERRWIKSDTTFEDMLYSRCRQVKRDAYLMGGIALAFLLYSVGEFLVLGRLNDWNFGPLMGAMLLLACASNLLRLKNELDQMGRKWTWKL